MPSLRNTVEPRNMNSTGPHNIFLHLEEMSPYIYIYLMAKFRKCTKIGTLARDHDVGM